MSNCVRLGKSIIEYIIRNFDHIIYFKINNEKFYKQNLKLDEKSNSISEFVLSDYNLKYNYISLIINKVDAIMFDKSEIKLKNGLFHSLNSPAFNYFGDGVPQKMYYINGVEYVYSE